MITKTIRLVVKGSHELEELMGIPVREFPEEVFGHEGELERIEVHLNGDPILQLNMFAGDVTEGVRLQIVVAAEVMHRIVEGRSALAFPVEILSAAIDPLPTGTVVGVGWKEVRPES